MEQRPGAQGYEQVGPDRLAAWDAVPVESAPEPAVGLLKAPPGRALDIGAGSGRVSAWLAKRGWRVDAVEPMAAFRAHAARVHGVARVRWLDDGLPGLEAVDGGGYDLAVCLAVLAHLDAAARRESLTRIADLLAPGGRLVVSLRIGAGPAARRHFEIDTGEFIETARESGLGLIFQTEAGSVQPENLAMNVTWLWIGFER